MAGYVKLFSSLLASTIWNEDLETRVVWITMLAMANRDGVVEGSIPGLAHHARVRLEAAHKALKKLSAPDPFSRSKESEGRRIIAIDGGWLLVNHKKYRASMDRDDRREYKRQKQSEYRKSRVSTDSPQCPQLSTVDNVDSSGHNAAPDPDPDPDPTTTRSREGGQNGNGNHVASPTKALMTLFDQLHRQKLHTKYSFTNAKKDAALVAKLHRDRHEETPNDEDIIRAFFASSDPFIAKAGYSIGVMMSQIPKLISHGRISTRGQNLRSVDWQTECKRLHNRRCTNVNFHAAKMAEQAEA